jgi:hypothetical protein
MKNHSGRRSRNPTMPAVAAVVLLTACVACHKRKPEPSRVPFPSQVAVPLVPSAPSAAERLPMIVGSPLFDLRVDIENCAYIVYVNGGLVTANMEGSAHEDQPINHWLNSGSNEIELHTYLSDAPDQCEAKLSLTLKDEDNEKDPARTALVLAYSAQQAVSGDPTRDSSPAGLFDSHSGFRASDRGDLRVGPAKVASISGNRAKIRVLSRTFDVHLLFRQWAFLRGDKMPTYWEFKNRAEEDAAYQEILGAYKKLWSFLDKHDVNGFLDACEERSREIDSAFYKRPGETRTHLRKDVESAMNDSEFRLSPVENSPGLFWTYTVGSTGRLIAVTQGDRASPIIRYVMKDGTPFSLIFPVVFRKEGSRYIVTR